METEPTTQNTKNITVVGQMQVWATAIKTIRK